jgi:hypothetical protein
MQRKMEEEEENNGDRLNILDEPVNLDSLDVHVINPPELKLENDILLDNIEILT